ncbi:MAG: tetratricopeptide repeat protein, partial [Alphaproteobacteria bacterium]|nr:tetratricopeptide repeat protein [Alphaproteobacteria bacterium]
MSIKTERLLSRAKKLAKNGEDKKAKEIYSNILKAFPDNQTAKKEFKLLTNEKGVNPSQLQLNEVMKLYETGNIKQALDYVESLIKDYPNESLLFNICGACHSEIGSIEPAIENFKKAIALKIDYSEAQFNLGVAFQKLNQL